MPRLCGPRTAAVAVGMALALSCAAGLTAPAHASDMDPAIAERLTLPQQRAYLLYLRARAAFDSRLDAYWRVVDAKREGRRLKHARHQTYTTDDYVDEQPPQYDGPPLPPDVARVIANLKPTTPEEPRSGLADFLRGAKDSFGFVPERISEREFKRRYAYEALQAGLTKEQVVRVYALETGGRGTYDMQAGIDPQTKQGRPISSAMGYAQLLHANSINELVNHGELFIRRLSAMAAARGIDQRRAALLRGKITSLRKMLRVARSVPNQWGAQVRLAGTERGLGIHAINLDGDIGPWLQVVKLRGLLDTARQAGRPHLPGSELELMNLAGPRTGLEMLQPIGRTMPTTNFFSRTGYYRNTIVRGKTGEQLLAALGQRMDENMKQAGAIEFAAVFDELMRQRR